MQDYLKDVARCLNPVAYGLLNKNPLNALTFMLKTTLLGIIIFGLLAFPYAFNLGDYARAKIDLFSKASIDGEFSTTKPILIPENNPWAVIDLESNRKKGSEELLITKNTIYFGKSSAEISEIKELKNHKLARYAGIIGVFVLPAIMFWIWIVFSIKYLAITLITGTLAWIAIDLTRWRMPYTIILSRSMQATTIMILIEMASMAVGTKYLLPFYYIWRVEFYTITIIAYLAVFLLSFLLAKRNINKTEQLSA
ncbi:hypothetical protein HY486_04145 [Candidatus Woesearchaeota archaeon]|nr:hypothetical protein [Candidatus Woesearchaeota archaeon]